MTQRPSMPPRSTQIGSTQYGPPAGPQYGAYGSLPPTYGSVPPGPPARKKSALGLVLGLSAGVIAVTVVAGGAYYFSRKSGPVVALPINAKQLPPHAKQVATDVIDSATETQPEVKRAYMGAELGRVCSDKFVGNPARQLEGLSTLGPQAAKTFFKKKNLAEVKRTMECGNLLAGSLVRPSFTSITFEEDEKTNRSVVVAQLDVTELPPKYGFSRRSFLGLPGFCQNEVDEKGSARDCQVSDRAAFRDGSTWFFGPVAALDDLARTVAHPVTELGVAAAALNDAAAATDGFSAARMQAKPSSTKPFFSAPCSWGAMHTAGNPSTFLEGCFPKSVDKLIEHVDSRIRAAAFETDDDTLKAGAVHGNILLVARDDADAVEVERDAREIMVEWKSHVSNNESKLIKLSTESAVTAREKSWAAIADTFVRALGKMEVKRKGRVVRIGYAEPLAAEDKSELADAAASTLDRRTAVADILGAIEQGRAIPEGPLAKLVGAPWSKFLVSAPQNDEANAKATYPEAECKSAQARLANVKYTDVPTSEGRAFYLQHRTADCKTRAPAIVPMQRGCLMTFKNGAEFAKCAPTFGAAGTVEPPESEFGIKKATK